MSGLRTNSNNPTLKGGEICLEDIEEQVGKTSKDTLTQHSVHIESDTLFLAGLGLPPAKLVYMPSGAGIALEGQIT